MNEIIIPRGLHIIVDDLGWFNGEDDRANGGPSRTAMPRNHVHQDYLAAGTLGRYIQAEISCPFIIGEWDPDNRLRGIPHLSKYGEGWNNAKYFEKNKEEAKLSVEIINSEPYLNVMLHGLLHGNYRDNVDNTDECDYFYRRNGEIFMAEEEEVRARLDAFFDLMKYHGINKRVDSFVPPTSGYKVGTLARILKEYGIIYGSLVFDRKGTGCDTTVEYMDDCGVALIDRTTNLVSWDEVAFDTDRLPLTSGIFGVHWPNILHEDPDRYPEVALKWARYFLRCADVFGTIIPPTLAEMVSQTVYRQYAKHDNCEGVIKIDLSELPKNIDMPKSFFVSSKEPITYSHGCRLEFFQIKDGFMNYKVTPTEENAELA